MTFTKEQIRKAMTCKTVDELLAYANSEGISITPEQAEEYIAQNGRRKLTDEELAHVVAADCAAACMSDDINNYKTKDK